jgi:hypothetical protein
MIHADQAVGWVGLFSYRLSHNDGAVGASAGFLRTLAKD